MKDDAYIYRITWFFIFIFLVLIGYLAYFTVTESKDIAVHPYNKRLDHLEDEVIRGNLYDENGIALVLTEGDTRQYVYGDAYSHVIGYSTRGKYGMEALANVELLYPSYSLSALFDYALEGEKFQGHHVVTTLNHALQMSAKEGLGNHKGAVVVLDATTGQIKAMYSSPTFDPNTISLQWASLSDDSINSPLLNRATQGLYPPASLFKIVTAMAYFENNDGDFTHNCVGSIERNGHEISCYDGIAHGDVGMDEAFAKSCNTYFIALSDRVTPAQLQDMSERLLFGQSLSQDIIHSKSQIEIENLDDFNTLASYIGQGKTLVTPLHMAVLASLIYNDGVLMWPYMLDYSISSDNAIRYKELPQYEGAFLDEVLAQKLKAMMVQVVEEGTAIRLYDSNRFVGGKTGTAQNETKIDHSWFIGFAEDPESHKDPIAFAVVVEQGGEGAKALDVTEKLLSSYFD